MNIIWLFGGCLSSPRTQDLHFKTFNQDWNYMDRTKSQISKPQNVMLILRHLGYRFGNQLLS